MSRKKQIQKEEYRECVQKAGQLSYIKGTKKAAPISKPHEYQCVWITLNDGSRSCFSGPAIAYPGDKRTIINIEWTPPKSLPLGHSFDLIEGFK